MLQNAGGVPRLPDVAVGNNRDGDGFFHLADAVPVGGSAIDLGPGTAVDRHGGGTRLLQSLGELHAVAAAHVPAAAELRGDRGARQGLHHRLHDAGGLVGVLHQSGAVAVIDDLGHGTAHIDIQNVRAGIFHGDLGGLRHTDRVAAEDLDGGGMLPGELGQQGEGLFVMVAQGLGGDELRAGQARAQFRTDLAEGHVRDAGHGCQGQPGIDFNIADTHGRRSFRRRDVRRFSGIVSWNTGLVHQVIHEKPAALVMKRPPVLE